MKKKRILYINQYFKHPKEPGVGRSYWITQALIKEGYDITMLAHRNTRHAFVDKNVPSVENVIVDDINVIYIKNEYDNFMGPFDRIRSFLRFMYKSTWVALQQRDVDFVIASSTPLTVAFPALILKWFKKTPFVFEVRDLWPEGPVQMGFIKNRTLIRFLRWFEKTTYRNALHVVAASPGMQEGVVKYIPKEKTSMIPNMAKIDRFWPREKNLGYQKELGLNEKSFKVVYFGTLGVANAIPYVLNAIEVINKGHNENIEFIFLGHGKLSNQIDSFILEKGATNIKHISRTTLEKVSEIVNFCNVSLVTFSNIPILATNSPNKFFDSLSAGIPIIVNSPGWTKDIVEKHNCGLFADPTDPGDLAKKILKLKSNPDLVVELGNNARILAEKYYDKTILTKKFVELINSLSIKQKHQS